MEIKYKTNKTHTSRERERENHQMVLQSVGKVVWVAPPSLGRVIDIVINVPQTPQPHWCAKVKQGLMTMSGS